MEDTPRNRAKANGRKTYIGKPCEHCWKRERYVCNRTCVTCHKVRYENMTDGGKAKEYGRVKAWRERKKAEREALVRPAAFDDLL